MLTSEMKWHAVIVALKADPGDLEIACFLRVARSFVHNRRMADNLYHHVTPSIWPPNSPDLNPLDYYVWSIVDKEVNKHPHNTKDSLKVAIVQVMSEIDKDE